MYFVALATDYGGTLAEDGVVAENILEALGLLKQSGRKLILVSGRELPDLRRVFSRLDLFDLAVSREWSIARRPRQWRGDGARRRTAGAFCQSVAATSSGLVMQKMIMRFCAPVGVVSRSPMHCQ
jgi:hypothetical protein